MNTTKALILLSILPSMVFSTTLCDGNTYEINQCLKAEMKKGNNQLNKISNHNVKNFKNYRNKICQDISSIYQGGSFQAIKYGNCIVSLNKWYFEQIRK